MKLAEKVIQVLSINETGRKKPEMVDLFESLRDTIVEHIWKIYAYGKNHRIKEINTRLKSLNKHLIKLRKFNKPKTGNKPNFDKSYLIDKLNGEDFQNTDDLELMANRWNEEDKPFPLVSVSVSDVKKIHLLTEKYIDLILDKRGKMIVTVKELGDL